MDILWLGDPACHDLTLVGGKVANLSRLTSEYDVPPGFCLTTALFTAASMITGEEVALPSSLFDRLAAAYRLLAERCGVADPPVAVRSSAVDEDGAILSFAGQYESYLNVTGVDAIANAAMRCLASARSDRAQDYRHRSAFSQESVRLAVLVQQMVMADISAIVFSANPVTGCREELVINASWGLGESIVGGKVNPDMYVVRKDDLSIITRAIAEKRRMTVPCEGGTHEISIPVFLRTAPSLTDEQIRAIARLGLSLETRMGWPVDAECVYRAGRLYLVQCRPITALRNTLVEKTRLKL